MAFQFSRDNIIFYRFYYIDDKLYVKKKKKVSTFPTLMDRIAVQRATVEF